MKKRSDILGVVLAGGKSKRFGRDKTFLAEGIVPVLSGIFDKVVIVTEDIIPDKGPLGGIYTALVQSSEPYVFIAACDMPFLKAQVIRDIIDNIDGFDIAAARGNPLCAVYSKNCIHVIKEALDKGELKVQGIFSRLNTKVIDIDKEIVNINTQEEYERWFRQGNRLSKNICD